MSPIFVFDTKTVTILIVANMIAIALAVFLSSSTYPRAISRSLVIFGFGKVLMAAAFTAVVLRSQLPLIVTLLGSNVLGLAGLYLSYSALRVMFGRRSSLAVLAVLCPVIAVAAIYSAGVQDLRFVRMTSALLCFGITGAMAYELLIRCHHTGFAHIVGGWVAVIMELVWLARFYAALASPPIVPALTVYSWGEQVFLVATFVAATLSAVNFILVSNDLFNEELRRLAATDALSGLANRRRLGERGAEELQRSMRYAKPLAVLAIDLDMFKAVNDRWGHATGDDVIKAVADCCAAQIREVDVIARTGGEEFVVILVEAGAETAEILSERLRREVEYLGLRAKDETPITVTISIGIAVLNGETSFEALWDRADQALYQAKAAGRNRVVYAPRPLMTDAHKAVKGTAHRLFPIEPANSPE